MIVGATDILGRQRYHIIGVMFKCDEKKPAAIGTLLIVQDIRIKKGYFSARGLGAKRIIGGGSTICKEAETILKYNFGLISHVIITCAF